MDVDLVMNRLSRDNRSDHAGDIIRKAEILCEHEQVLQNAVITEGGHGTILQEFNLLLEFLGEQGFPVTGTHQLPIRALPEINARLTHSFKQGLTRPQQKSYPHINGLYLLLRGSGMTFSGGWGKKPLLFVDKEMAKA